MACQLMSGSLPRLVIILIEDDVDTTPGCVGKLRQVGGAQMGANGAGSIAKASLPQYGQIEQTLNQDHDGEVPNRVPGEQSSFRAEC